MKYLTGTIVLLFASTLASANDAENQAAEQPLVVAYNTVATAKAAPAKPETIAQTRSERALKDTLGAVSSSLSFELDEKIRAEFPIVGK